MTINFNLFQLIEIFWSVKNEINRQQIFLSSLLKSWEKSSISPSGLVVNKVIFFSKLQISRLIHQWDFTNAA